MKKLFIIFPILSLLLSGAGCVIAPQSSSEQSNTNSVETNIQALSDSKKTEVVEVNNENIETVEVVSCPEGTILYFDESVGLQFCYPATAKTEKNHGEYFVKDASGSVLKDIAVYNYDTSNLSEFLVDNFVNSNAKGLGYTCEILDSQWSHGTVHSVVGSDQSGQSLEAVDACRDTQRYKTALTNLSAEYFFEPTKPNGYFAVINGGQEPLLDEYENAFSDSISFR